MNVRLQTISNPQTRSVFAVSRLYPRALETLAHETRKMLLMSPDAKGGLKSCLGSVVLIPASTPGGLLVKFPLLSV
jgi:hypothetical protein